MHSNFENWWAARQRAFGMTSVPYSRKVPLKQEKDSYNFAPTRLVLFKDTPLAEALEDCDNPIGAAFAEYFHDGTLMAAVEQSIKAQADVDWSVHLHNERAEVDNEPIYQQLAELHELEKCLLSKWMKAKDESHLQLESLHQECAKALSMVGLVLDPTRPLPQIPRPETLMSPEAYAAKLKLPIGKAEESSLGYRIGKTVATWFVASAQGVSIGAISGIVSLSAIDRHLGTSGFCMLLGCSVAFFVGDFIKGQWREVREAKYRGDRWIFNAGLSTLLTAGIAAIEVAIDTNGLMAYRSVHASVSALSGSSANISQAGLELFLICGAIVSIPYALWCAMTGWNDASYAARNRLVLAQEEERQFQLSEIEDQEGWSEALASCNAIIALKAHQVDTDKHFEEAMAQISKRREHLKSHLTELRTTGTEADIARVDKTRTEVSGLWGELNNLILSLQRGRIVRVQRRIGFWNWIKKIFGLKKAGGHGS